MQKPYSDGDWHSNHGQEMIDIIDPSTEYIIDRVPRSNELVVENCVNSASKAFEKWQCPGAGRGGTRKFPRHEIHSLGF